MNKKKLQHTAYNLKLNSGFSLVEVMVSMFILTVGILSILSLISDTLKNVDVTKNSVIAANLAQEGIEVVRGLRDANWINNNSYDFEFVYVDTCVNYSSASFIDPCPDFSIYWDSINKVFAHSGNTPTSFQRTIRVTKIANPEDDPSVDPDPMVLQVQSIVTWEGRTIIAEEHLYDWR